MTDAANSLTTGPIAAPDAPALWLEGLRVSYDGKPLLAIDMAELAAGRITCLLGASGAGKSTLLKLIAGLNQPEAGSITASDQQPLPGRIAYMAQSDCLLPWLNVIGNVRIGERLRGEPTTKQSRDRAMARLAELGLSDKAFTLPATLSGGERQRVALARTLFEDRPVVLMDEPFSALDAITRSRLQEIAARVLSGRTVIMVTHDPLEALRLGHEVRVLNGSPATLQAPLRPEDKPPRRTDAAALWQLHETLLVQLAEA
jgi:putative hydroxymethylpyrimidine transport system ATP-binding protein